MGVEDSSARKRTGVAERKAYQPGPKVRVDREAVWRLLEAQPDPYQRELQAELKLATGIQMSTPHLRKQEHPPHWIRPSPICCPPSVHRTQPHGSDCRSSNYTIANQL